MALSRPGWLLQLKTSYRNQQHSNRTIALIIAAVIGNLLLLILLHDLIKVSPYKPWLDKIYNANKGRYNVYYNPERMYEVTKQ
jgi:hypothetical protein